jgi:hypothetical protein
MTDFSRKILLRTKTRAGAGVFVLKCGHEIAVSGPDWSSKKTTIDCHECQRNAEHKAADGGV